MAFLVDLEREVQQVGEILFSEQGTNCEMTRNMRKRQRAAVYLEERQLLASRKKNFCLWML
ncbi:hypothetical protein A7975_22065 [Bacillus sp. FJAT-26390]|nr:hypothetical protein A7975_22065 [Bacillus sp. FJAT-26390]